MIKLIVAAEGAFDTFDTFGARRDVGQAKMPAKAEPEPQQEPAPEPKMEPKPMAALEPDHARPHDSTDADMTQHRPASPVPGPPPAAPTQQNAQTPPTSTGAYGYLVSLGIPAVASKGYAAKLNADGFDNVAMVNTLTIDELRDDYDFKKGHLKAVEWQRTATRPMPESDPVEFQFRGDEPLGLGFSRASDGMPLRVDAIVPNSQASRMPGLAVGSSLHSVNGECPTQQFVHLRSTGSCICARQGRLLGIDRIRRPSRWSRALWP